MRNVTRLILPAILLLTSVPALAGTLVTDLTPWEEVEGTLVLEGDLIRYDAIRRNEDGSIELRTPGGDVVRIDPWNPDVPSPSGPLPKNEDSVG